MTENAIVVFNERIATMIHEGNEKAMIKQMDELTKTREQNAKKIETVKISIENQQKIIDEANSGKPDFNKLADASKELANLNEQLKMLEDENNAIGTAINDLTNAIRDIIKQFNDFMRAIMTTDEKNAQVMHFLSEDIQRYNRRMQNIFDSFNDTDLTFSETVLGITKTGGGGVGQKQSNQEKADNFWDDRLGSWIFPLSARPSNSLTTGQSLGSDRDGGKRAHAGVDLIVPAGTEVIAMSSGSVIRVAPFYAGTDAVEVLHTDGTVVRYTEIKPSVKVGDNLKQGDVIGAVIANNQSGASMLHIEVYLGTSTGSLSNPNNKEYDYLDFKNYERRSDLIDPMDVLKLK